MEQNKIRLRAVEPSDASRLFDLENDREIWDVSGTQIPFSMESIRLFIEGQQSDIFISRQARFMIESKNMVVGCIDLFDFDPVNHKAGVGILVGKAHRMAGYGLQALLELEYIANRLQLHQLYAHVGSSNEASLNLFKKAGYFKSGELIDWIKDSESWQNAIIFQKIFKKHLKSS